MRLTALSFIAKLFGIRFKVDGIPYGSNYSPPKPSEVRRPSQADF